MAVTLFDLDKCEHGIALPGHLFASMPIAPSSRRASRQPSPAPLEPVAEQGRLDDVSHHGFELDTPDSCDSAHSDVFDEPAWFGHDALTATLNSACQAFHSHAPPSTQASSRF